MTTECDELIRQINSQHLKLEENARHQADMTTRLDEVTRQVHSLYLKLQNLCPELPDLVMDDQISAKTCQKSKHQINQVYEHKGLLYAEVNSNVELYNIIKLTKSVSIGDTVFVYQSKGNKIVAILPFDHVNEPEHPLYSDLRQGYTTTIFNCAPYE